MDSPNFRRTSPNSFDQTLDTPDVESAMATRRQCLALVEGTSVGISSETRDLLRGRLRASALVLFGGTASFLLWTLIVPEQRARFGWGVMGLQFALVVALGTSSALLCRKNQISTQRLRALEALIFGFTAVVFLAFQRVRFLDEAAHGRLFNPIGLWFGLMFTYSLFIPNTWRRAAPIIVAMAVAPLALLGVSVWESSALAGLINSEYMVELLIMILAGAVASVLGIYNIGSLRQEAFTARQMGQYRLRHKLGAGGMGEVYLAEHQLLKRPCAIKIIRPGKECDPTALARFEREVRATARLTHWNTVEIFDYGRTDDGTFYYVMEYLPGLSLAELVERHGPLPADRAIHLLRQTCDALREAHALGLIHRDIKPGNVIASQRGGVYDVAKLLDFGLAKTTVQTGGIELTQEGAITGSPLYMSPEQAGGEDPDARSDIYSLGAVAYYMLTGRPPFEEDKPLKVMAAHLRNPVVPPSQHRSEVPDDLEQVVLRCLAKNPAGRFSDAESLERALADCVAAGDWTRDRAARWWDEQKLDAATAAT